MRLKGLEPLTNRLKVYCSTTELQPHLLVQVVGFEPTPQLSGVNLVFQHDTLANFPSLRPHALSRDRRCLWSTDLYSGRWSYTTLWSRFLSLSHTAESDLIHRFVKRVCFSQLRYSVKTVRPLVVSVPSQHLYYNTLDKVCQEVFTKLSNKCACR